MIPIKFKGMNTVFAKDQPEYLPLPAHREEGGQVTTCWKLSIIERVQVLFKGTLWLRTLTFNQPLQPLKLSVKCLLKEIENG